MIAWCAATLSGTFALEESRAYLAYVWAFIWGILLGWFYPCENLYFSMAVPAGQEAEMTGFFLYMNNVLVWLPPFIVSLIIEAGASTRWGFLSLLIFQALALACMMMTAPWEEVLEESNKKVVDPDLKLDNGDAASNEKVPEAIKEADNEDEEEP